MKTLLRTLRAAALFAVLAAGARASDWYVDAVAGSNSNSGTSPIQAWKTITHAVANTPPGSPQTIHVAPGTYDSALGEAFPWLWRPSLALIGDQGSAVTHVLGVAGSAAIFISSSAGGVSYPSDTLIQGLHFQGGTRAIGMYSNWSLIDPTLRDLAIDGMSSTGIEIVTYSQSIGALARPLLDHVAVSGCPVGMNMSAYGSGQFAVTVTDSSFAGNGIGVLCSATYVLQATFERCRIEQSGGWGLSLGGANNGLIDITLHATTIAHNGGGIWGGLGTLLGTTRTTGTQCTIAHNGGIGVKMEHVGSHGSTVKLDSSIVHGHADDLAIDANSFGAGSTLQYCEIGDGELAGTSGNFQADPLFVNAPAGDYRLLPGSPCIDTGMPALPLELDCSRADVGAFPFSHPQSLVYCTAKVNSCGGLPSIGASGTASATAPNGYLVSASGAKATKPGLLLYSLAGRAAAPFGGGILCVAAPVRRSITVVDSTGTPGLCNGVLRLDMNAFARGTLGGNPQSALSVAGTRVDCQYWGRDTLAGALLSDALEYFVCQ